MSIKVNAITKKYGAQLALNNVSFTINTGEIVGFLGPNGAGKSTMMKILTGFIPPTSGDAFVNNIDVVENPIDVKKIIGYLPENNPLYLDMYVKEYLEFVSGIYKLGKNTKPRIKEVIEMTGIGDEQRKKIGALSKGYRQRVGLMQALIHNPEVLILDEPTSGLDPNQIIEIRNLISDIGKEKTILLSTHIMQEVEAICSRVIIIDKGNLIADDATDSIVRNKIENKQTIVVEFNSEVTANSLKKIKHVNKVANIDEKNWIIQASTEEDIRPLVFDFAVSKGIQVLSMQKKEKSLEDVFRELNKFTQIFQSK